MMYFWHLLSLIGSLAVTGPVGAAIAIYLIAGKQWRLTLAWGLLFGVGMAVVVVTKMLFVGWGIGIESVEFAGISGHAMRAAAVYPVAGYLVLRSSGPYARYVGAGVGVLLAVLISISRVPTLAHSVSEVVSGAILGLAVAGVFIYFASREHRWALSRMLAVLCLPIVLVAPNVEPIPAEDWITQAALKLSGRDHPYSRAMWHHHNASTAN
ncbi:membrane-associated phospholipid phosphatase [Duganella sp. Leaf126]|uniref:phosphatase PAP2 family protein n=1 Tax=Duganella sp. Leaf126 TaxID=1736266 RepID=UPI0006FD0BAC|nr:phosphatase PAP2 family protein [Duganella sp. Leaf126]KQQ36064.1 membrane-associated phospholipid phosphatase [Duganella sp. Leaf126]